ncbi:MULTISPECIES: two-partner secretion domain-containing protein [unclassified Tolypothrix]|uniref:two-partner secretion domain-containing protein n=1 Tax=unclassified Tolypothrix TaxID=2649714 RepID=UPI0005EABA2E|nr:MULTISPECIES: S-layer family protein [unclassified Tolypothrix]BAY89337.1 filamentous hemagglutinin-like protein [Microchaete diplosiphon NIES-3275]EKE97687.1 protein, filamentous hemagglutinin family [Tolypothrix sp. PCC 7601]MBE9084053.1 S-layer family protein [Tolypothrix sp. LEGE 11397]UYD23616.1 S-layer family protein [Tolypothrix sp. PCC 7712]UYD34157.1 S-layer family protein [Tolypothrix sp. PCC 7601]
MKLTFVGFAVLSTICLSAVCNNSVYAQVTSDGTLGTVVNGNNNYSITEGTRVGNNLFHSFSQFSILTGSSASFDNPTDIQNIFSRVSGGSISNIDGLISAKGSANLFLLNPSGIIFGPNASLNIGGSFIATTANSIKFADGTEFSAVDSAAKPLLTMTVPIGLQMGNHPAPIQVQGTGHSLDTTDSFSPVIPYPSATKLQVQSGKTLALVGGNISLDGATLSAQTGQIELGSLGGAGLVSLAPITQGYQLQYEQGQSFADIQLAQKSLLDVSGFNSGAVQLQGRNIKFTDGSVTLSQNYGNLKSGDINVQASDAIALIGTTPDAKIYTWIRADALGTGDNANISIVTPRLIMQESSGISNLTYGTANGGNIQIQAADIELSGFSPLNPTGVTAINTVTFGKGAAGDILVNGNNLLMFGGASLVSLAFGSGSTGQVMIRNQNTTVMGENPFGVYSNMSITTFADGNAKDLRLDTGNLQVLNGGVIGSSALFIGNGGNVQINASEAIAISGRGSANNSNINSSAVRLSPQLSQLLGVSDILTANAGSLSITTPKLTITDGGTVTVTGQGTGNAGNLKITADQIQLQNQALIEAQTESGNGGDISLQVGDVILMRDRSKITATADGAGDGGNININAPIIVGLENSDITANAVRGKGGNINITTQGIIGLEYSSQLTAENNITASSEFGVNGTVEVNNIGVDPNSGLVELPANVTDSSQQIASGCSRDSGSSFVASGRGGVPQNPTQELRSDRPWSDTRDISAFHTTKPAQAQIPTTPQILVQATGWRRNANGKIELVANQSPTQVQTALTCAATPQI